MTTMMMKSIRKTSLDFGITLYSIICQWEDEWDDIPAKMKNYFGKIYSSKNIIFSLIDLTSTLRQTFRDDVFRRMNFVFKLYTISCALPRSWIIVSRCFCKNLYTWLHWIEENKWKMYNQLRRNIIRFTEWGIANDVNSPETRIKCDREVSVPRIRAQCVF